MEKSLFGEGRFYKANLHNHTVVSDGDNTPEEIKKIYQAQGYDVVAYSDHDVMVEHSDLTDDKFLALTAVEYEFTEELPEEVPYDFLKTYHTVLIAPRADIKEYPWPNPDFAWGNGRNYVQPWYTGDCPRDYDVNCVNQMIRDAHAKGYLVTYCHPHWSTQTYPDYCDLQNVDFVETFNTGCYIGGWDLDACDHVYQDFLTLGTPCAPTASDDGHSAKDYTWGATYIHSESLRYEDIFKALSEKNVYASWGPEIKDIRFDKETGKLTIDCSDAEEVHLVTERRFCRRFRSMNGSSVSQASFDLSNYIAESCKFSDPAKCFVRLVVVDPAGRKALSRGYFLSELLKLE